MREGPLTKVCRKDRQRRWFFLFSDCLVYCTTFGQTTTPTTPSASASSSVAATASSSGQVDNSGKYLIHRMINLNACKVAPLDDTKSMVIITTTTNTTILHQHADFWMLRSEERVRDCIYGEIFCGVCGHTIREDRMAE